MVRAIPSGRAAPASAAEPVPGSGKAGIPIATCALCDDEFDTSELGVSIEAFEVTGELYCEHCAEDVLTDHAQFGVGA